MTNIELSVLVEKSRERVYAMLKNLEEFPRFMRDIRKLEVVERAPHRLVTHWEVNVDGAMVAWKEEDIFDDKAMNVKFKMLEGDYTAYSGRWDIKDLSRKTKINLTVDIDWGAPAFEKVIGSILRRKEKRYLKSMLMAMKNHLNKA